MNRRNFLASTVGLGSIAMQAKTSPAKTSEQQFFELIKYHLQIGPKKNLVRDFYRDAAIPTLNRLGIGPVGVFNVMFGSSSPTLYVLLPHNSLESVITASHQIFDDPEFIAAGKNFISATLDDPAFVRMESSLLLAFKKMPKLEPPDQLQNKSRIFELRIYESHSKKANLKKIEMFNDAGEIEIFRKTGLNPVLFGETIIGRQMPSLTYMLAFESVEARMKNWNNFRTHPDWLKLREESEYKGIVSNITDIILRPESCSQI